MLAVSQNEKKTKIQVWGRGLPKIETITGESREIENFQKMKKFKNFQSLFEFESNHHGVTIRARAALFRVLGLRLAAFGFAEKS